MRALSRQLTSGSIIDDPDVLASYARDHAALVEAGRPAAAVLARTAEEVQATLSFASENGMPVVPRGAGSGLSGGANAVDGCIVLVTTEMDRIEDLSSSGLFARVEPGVINGDLKRAARGLGLSYPPDPASADFCTLGGNIATNAGGLACLKYGVTRDYVMSLDVVLADGSRIETGAATRKNAAGYDLTSLIVGSEGTLGVVVGATLRLIPEPPAPSTVVAVFNNLVDVAGVPLELVSLGMTPSLLEVIDRATINAVEDRFPMGLDRSAEALVIAQFDSIDSAAEATRMANLMSRMGATEAYETADPAESEMLLQARKLAYTALEQGEGVPLLDDVAVPVPRLVDLMRAIQQIGQASGVRVATFGHLGDGSLHPTVMYEAGDPKAVERAKRVFDEMVEAALQLGGVVTGEHGVGLLKVAHLGEQIGPTAATVHERIRESLDPKRILNPGKIVAFDPTAVS